MRRMTLSHTPLLVGALFMGCSGQEAPTPTDSGTVDATLADAGGMDASEVDAGLVPDAGPPDAGFVDAGEPEPLTLTTTAFMEGEVIPLRYECGGVIRGPGENISPDLAWSGGPLEAESYAVIMDDVDSGVVNWVAYDLPKETRAIEENVPAGYQPAELGGGKQAEIQGSTYFGYFGPCSPGVVNTYRWTIHAIGTAELEGATRDTTEYEMVRLIQAQSLGSDSFSGES